jgi:hypothetical protein
MEDGDGEVEVVSEELQAGYKIVIRLSARHGKGETLVRRRLMMFGSQGVERCEECPQQESYSGNLRCNRIVADECPRYALGETYHSDNHGLSVVERVDYTPADEAGSKTPLGELSHHISIL